MPPPNNSWQAVGGLPDSTREPQRSETGRTGAVFVTTDRLHTNRYEFNSSARVGCTQLLRVSACDKSGIHRTYLGKLVPQPKLAAFLRTEGAALRVLNAAPHPNLPRVRCCIEPTTATEPSCMVFPSLTGGDLHSFVRANRSADGGIPEALAQRLFRQITSGVSHCHSHGVVLRDIKLGKIVFTNPSRTEVVIADLDGAEVISRQAPLLSDQKGSPAYVSPEVLVCRPYDGTAADVWALGVVLYMMLTGTYPFQDNQPARLFDKIQHAWRAVSFPASVSPSARDLIKSLLTKQPDRRPSAEELLAHPWVYGRLVSPATTTTVPLATLASTAAGVTPAAFPDDQLVPDVGSPGLPRKDKGRQPVTLQPLHLPAPLHRRDSLTAASGSVASPMYAGGMLQKMWQPADISASAGNADSSSVIATPAATSAKRRRESIGSIEHAFSLKAAQHPKLHEWATATSQPPSPALSPAAPQVIAVGAGM